MKKRTQVGLRQLTGLMGIAPLCIGLALTHTLRHTPQPVPAHTSVVQAPVPVIAVKHPHRWFQIGKASWYGEQFQGKPTATGEPFNMNALTCAHRTLPLGSWLRVTNLRNRRSTLVRVNDRGPFVEGTVIDLSYAAARRVGIFGKAKVRVDPVSAKDPEVLHAQLETPDTPNKADED